MALKTLKIARRVAGLVCLLAVVSIAAQAKQTVWEARIWVNGSCLDCVFIDLGNGCMKRLSHSCDEDAGDCGWEDSGWNCRHDIIIPAGAELLTSVFDGAGNLLCSVAPGAGGIFAPPTSTGGSTVCFTPNSSSTMTITAALLAGLQ